MTPDVLTIAGPLVGSLVTALGAWLVYRASRMSSKASPYDKLAERVVKLEGQVGELRDKVDALESERSELRDLVRTMHAFIQRHVPQEVVRPFLRPPWL